MDAIMEIAKEYRLYVIEDAAEAHGAEYRGRKVGAIGDVGCLSFFVNKVVTTGEGGMLLTNDDKIAERARFLKNLGYANRDKFLHTDLAYNFRFTNLQAAIGVAQMSRFEEVIAKKRNVAAMYTSRLREIRSLQLPVEESWAKNIYWMYSVVLEDGLPDRQTVRDRLDHAGVETRNFFHPLHKQPAFQKAGFVTEADSLPIAERLGERGLYLPSSPSLTEKEVDTICQKLRDALELNDRDAWPELRQPAGV
jgi:perosamine synthetase